jgi:nitroreductase
VISFAIVFLYLSLIINNNGNKEKKKEDIIMKKEAPADHKIHPLLAQRWSPRAISSKKIPEADLLSLFEAARWAPSCYNDQPWHFIIATRDNEQQFSKMLDCLVEKNREWAGKAYLLIIGVAKKTFRNRDKINRHSFHDLGLALENLMIQATWLGLCSHAMAGFSVEKARNTYEIPEDFEPLTALALGYPGEPDSLPEDLKKMEYAERQRLELTDLLFKGKWGQSYS